MISFNVPGPWPTSNALLDLARKGGARQQERKARGMKPCVDEFNQQVRDWKLRVKAAAGYPPSRFVDAVAVVVRTLAAGQRDVDSPSLAVKYAVDALMPKDHHLRFVAMARAVAPGFHVYVLSPEDLADKEWLCGTLA